MHVPVMLDEVLGLLQPERAGLFVDCTVGWGGHARGLLEGGATRLLGLDRDPTAVSGARAALAAWGDRVEIVHADYRDLPRLLDDRGIAGMDGALLDLGVSSVQLDADGRGFSFRRDEPLDMRMDQSQGETAAERLARVGEVELADVIYRFGDERHSRRIARAIVASRAARAVETTGQLAAIVRRAIPGRGWRRIDPATRTFQALRIWVNGELDGLERLLETAVARLHRGRRLAVLTFHSLEDRIVKQTFRSLARERPADSGMDRPVGQDGREVGAAVSPIARLLTRRPMTPTDEEVARNPRARSAKLRGVERA